MKFFKKTTKNLKSKFISFLRIFCRKNLWSQKSAIKQQWNFNQSQMSLTFAMTKFFKIFCMNLLKPNVNKIKRWQILKNLFIILSDFYKKLFCKTKKFSNIYFQNIANKSLKILKNSKIVSKCSNLNEKVCWNN
jgi:hypothetical protein